MSHQHDSIFIKLVDIQFASNWMKSFETWMGSIKHGNGTCL